MAAIKKLSHKFVVAKGRNLVVRRNGQRVTLKGGVVIPDGALSKRDLEDSIRAGFVVKVGYEEDVEPEVLPMVKEDGTLDEAPPPPPRAALSAFNLNPKKLKGKDLDSLNALIIERDPSHTPAASIPEAIKILSADFQG
ncbi:MAG: hypothetical protein LC123_02350 [Burkholderiales bacterium]|nr:hypothetical protein [Burkholderiales bacterium]